MTQPNLTQTKNVDTFWSDEILGPFSSIFDFYGLGFFKWILTPLTI